MHPDAHFDIVMAKGAGRDLQDHSHVTHGVIGPHLPVFLDAQDIVDVEAGDGYEGRRLHLGRNRDRKSTRLHSSHYCASRMPSSACKIKIRQKSIISSTA